jgi:hypothetical protein
MELLKLLPLKSTSATFKLGPHSCRCCPKLNMPALEIPTLMRCNCFADSLPPANAVLIRGIEALRPASPRYI